MGAPSILAITAIFGHRGLERTSGGQNIACIGRTGNVTKRRDLAQGIVEAGRPADLVFMDRPGGSQGDDVLGAMAMGNIPGIAAVMIDGKMRTGRSRSTPPSARVPVV